MNFIKLKMKEYFFKVHFYKALYKQPKNFSTIETF